MNITHLIIITFRLLGIWLIDISCCKVYVFTVVKEIIIG